MQSKGRWKPRPEMEAPSLDADTKLSAEVPEFGEEVDLGGPEPIRPSSHSGPLDSALPRRSSGAGGANGGPNLSSNGVGRNLRLWGPKSGQIWPKRGPDWAESAQRKTMATKCQRKGAPPKSEPLEHARKPWGPRGPRRPRPPLRFGRSRCQDFAASPRVMCQARLTLGPWANGETDAHLRHKGRGALQKYPSRRSTSKRCLARAGPPCDRIRPTRATQGARAVRRCDARSRDTTRESRAKALARACTWRGLWPGGLASRPAAEATVGRYTGR